MYIYIYMYKYFNNSNVYIYIYIYISPPATYGLIVEGYINTVYTHYLI